MRPDPQQVQAVRRRMVQPQVRQLQRSGWAVVDADVLADCVLAAGGDPLLAHTMMTEWELLMLVRTPDMTAEDEERLVAYVSTEYRQRSTP